MDTKHCLNCPHHKTQYDQYGVKYCYCFYADFGRWVAEIKECPLNQDEPEKDIVTEYDEQFYSDPVYGKLVNRNAGIAIARHFFELGQKKMRKRISNPEYNKEVIEKMKSEYPDSKEECR